VGHLANKNEFLVKLRERLDRNPIGLPEDINVYEILSILFTNEEAYLASKFPLDPATLEDLQVVTNIPPGQLKELLSAMLKKGLVLETKKRGQPRFMLSMALVGFFEFIFMRTNQSLPMKKLAELIHDYRLGPKFSKELFNPTTPRARALLYETVVPEIKTEILTFELAAELIKEAGRGGLTNCYCRHEAQHLNQACDNPVEDICISLGTAADFLIERGFARKASISEILEKLSLAKELGLIHTCDNVRHNVAFICNCCGCCCCFLAGITKHQLPNAVLTTNYIATIDENICIGCSECIKSCQVEAIKYNEINTDVTNIDTERCLGCGACVNFCEQNAIQMVKRKERILPPANMSELMIRLKQDRGK